MPKVLLCQLAIVEGLQSKILSGMSRVQWNLRIVDTIGTTHLSFVERLSSFGGYFVQSVHTRVQMMCPLLGGLSSFGVSFIGDFTVGPCIELR